MEYYICPALREASPVEENIDHQTRDQKNHRSVPGHRNRHACPIYKFQHKELHRWRVQSWQAPSAHRRSGNRVLSQPSRKFLVRQHLLALSETLQHLHLNNFIVAKRSLVELELLHGGVGDVARRSVHAVSYEVPVFACHCLVEEILLPRVEILVVPSCEQNVSLDSQAGDNEVCGVQDGPSGL